MDYLIDYEFSQNEINKMKKDISSNILKLLIINKDNICKNLNYIKNLKIDNYKIIFNNFYEIFLLDNSTFENIFNKYDINDLRKKILINPNIIEYL
jgi:molecular chaperone GrpE (heat shock protein)